jgi:protein SCO1
LTARSLVRNPYFWGFLIGIVTLTLIRPLLRHIPDPPPVLSQLPEFSLVGSDGKPYGSAELKGQVYIASFFFTSCRSICPAIMKGVARLQNGFAERKIDGIRLVSISVDPEHDTPEVLTDYAKGLGIDPNRWTLLTGDPEAVRRLVVDGFKTPLASPAPERPEPMDIAHTGKLVLVDGSGRIRGYYDSTELGLDEVYNRAQHVLRQQRERASKVD